jgi:hypothetical protein
MPRHRGLIVTLVVAVVVGGILVGVMALANGDDEGFVVDDLAAQSFRAPAALDDAGGLGLEPALVTIYNHQSSPLEVTPLWDAYNNCVSNNPFPSRAVVGKDREAEITAEPIGSGSCFFEKSRMHWLMKDASGSLQEEIRVTNFSSSSVECVDLAGRDKFDVECSTAAVHVSAR